MGERLRKLPHDLARDDRKLLGRHEDPMDVVVASTDGSLVRDARGRTLIDFEMGWCVGNLGWNHPAITARLRAFAGPSYVSPDSMYEPWLELARRLIELAPAGLSRAYRATTGTEAVELALQIAFAYTERDKLVTIEGAYHGNSIATRSIGEPLAVQLASCKHLAPPLDTKALDRLETLLRRRDVAAFVIEPVITNLGVLIPSPAFLRGASELCERYETVFVADEVACGFGRTGALFACEHAGVTPDILCLAKAITNGHAPLGATLVTSEIAGEIREDVDFYATFGWHPLAVEAALATLGYFADHGDQLMTNVAAQSSYFMSRLLAMPWDGEIRIKGLAIGIDVGDGERVTEIAEACRDRGLLIGDADAALVMFPALTIDRDTAKEGLDILERVVTA